MCQLMFGVMREAVGRGQRQLWCDVQFDVGFQPVPDPAHPHPAHRTDTRQLGEHVVGGVDESGVDTVQESAEHLAGRDDHHHRDGGRDEQADDRVGSREAQTHPGRPGHHRQRRQPVGTGVQAIGPQRR